MVCSLNTVTTPVANAGLKYLLTKPTTVNILNTANVIIVFREISFFICIIQVHLSYFASSACPRYNNIEKHKHTQGIYMPHYYRPLNCLYTSLFVYITALLALLHLYYCISYCQTLFTTNLSDAYII